MTAFLNMTTGILDAPRLAAAMPTTTPGLERIRWALTNEPDLARDRRRSLVTQSRF